MTTQRPAGPDLPGAGSRPARGRLVGVDVARSLALLGMMATHVFPLVDDDAEPTAASWIASGRSAAVFAVLAGVSLALLSGGPRPVTGRARTATAAGLAVRALVVLAIGLLLGWTDSVLVILPFYALMFGLAVPLLGLTARALLLVAGGLAALGPVVLVLAARAGAEFGERPDPTPVTLVTEPLGVLGQLLVTGEYPVVVYLAYVAVGLALGRLDLGSPRLAVRLLAVGLALAVAARLVSAVLLHPLGGLRALVAASGDGEGARWVEAELLWEPDQGSSWWYLALASPHSHTQLDVLHTVGSAVAVLGACLLVVRHDAVRRLLTPLARMGAMPLTVYTGHILVLEVFWLDVPNWLTYAVVVLTALAFAVVWHRRSGRGPLEAVAAAGAQRARRHVLQRTPREREEQA